MPSLGAFQAGGKRSQSARSGTDSRVKGHDAVREGAVYEVIEVKLIPLGLEHDVLCGWFRRSSGS